MKAIRPFSLVAVAFLALASSMFCSAAELSADQQKKIDAKVAELKSMAAAPAIVSAVAAQNKSLPSNYASMTQDQWKKLSVLDPFVRGFAKNEAGAYLKANKPAWVSEAFVSDANGLKVAFLAKTSNWSHGNSAKHVQPMAGKVWQGNVELDESTGLQQLQVSVPVVQNGSAIGSLVVGIALSNLD